MRHFFANATFIPDFIHVPQRRVLPALMFSLYVCTPPHALFGTREAGAAGQ